MTRKIYGRIQMDSGYFSDTHISIAENGWVHVEEPGRWYPPSQVQYIDPSDDEPDR